MADTFRLQGSYQSTPASGTPSGDPFIDAPIEETQILKRKQVLTLELDTDSPEAAVFGDLAAAHVVIIRAYGGKVRARFTSSDGSLQAAPVDPFLTLMSAAVPVTALDLTRVSGSGTTVVKVFLGEKA